MELDQTKNNIKQDVLRLKGFNQFDEKQIEEISKKFNRINIQMGEPIILEDKIPNSIFFLIDGEIRILGQSKVKRGLKSILITTAPYIIGWPSVMLGESIEYISAASECNLLAINLEDWMYILAHNVEIHKLYLREKSYSEIWFTLLTNDLEKELPLSPKEMRSRVKEIYNNSNIYLSQENSIQNKLGFPDGAEIFNLNSNSKLPLGSKCNDLNIEELTLGHKKTKRFLSIPKNLISKGFNYSDLKNNDANEIVNKEQKTIKDNNELAKHKEKAKEKEEIKELKTEEQLEQDNPNNKFRFFSSAPGAVDEMVACFRILSHIIKLPLKVDQLRKILNEQEERSKDSITIQLAARIAETLGLQTQLLYLPTSYLTRLETPTFIQLPNNELSVLISHSKTALEIARPLSGLEVFTLSEIADLAGEDGKLPVLTLKRTSRTPTKKFSFAWFLPSIKKNRRALIEVFIASFFVQLFQLMNPLIIQQVIDKVIGKGGLSTLPVLASLLFLFSVFENILTAVRTNLFIDTTNRIDISLGEQVIDHLLRLPLSYFDKRPVGELSSRLGELENIRKFLTGTALTVVLDAMFSVIYIAVMIMYSWILTIIALLVAPLLALITFAISPIIRRQLRTKAEDNAKTQNHLIEVLTGIQTVKAQNFELQARWRWKERYSKYISESFKNAVTSTASNGFTKFLNQASTLSVLCVGAYLVVQGQLTLGELIAFRIISGYVLQPLLRLSNVYQSFQQTQIALERLADIVDTVQESSEEDSNNIPMPQIKGAIKFEDVCFRFSQAGQLNLSNINLTLPAGKFIAIVGQSGSGKSTLTKLIPRLYEPLSGKISIDNYDISKVELYSLRRQIGIVPQDSLLFEGSVQENIALTDPDINTEEIVAAAKVAAAHDFIMNLPMGYASNVGERGASLSGGQRQRIAIARTILRKPRLLIMDEATSALDYETEREVSINLMQHFRDSSVLFITHRLHSIINADLILVMNNGIVDEMGTHEELIEKKGRYSTLFSQQEASQIST